MQSPLNLEESLYHKLATISQGHGNDNEIWSAFSEAFLELAKTQAEINGNIEKLMPQNLESQPMEQHLYSQLESELHNIQEGQLDKKEDVLPIFARTLQTLRERQKENLNISKVAIGNAIKKSHKNLEPTI